MRFFLYIAKKLSKFAQERAIKVTTPTVQPESTGSSSISKNIIIGAIVERIESDAMNVDTSEEKREAKWEAGFPKPTRIDQNVPPLALSATPNIELY